MLPPLFIYPSRNNINPEYNGYRRVPLKLLSFTGEMKEGGSELTWTTAEEEGITGFDVERSNDGSTFSIRGYVPANGMRNNTYHFTDRIPAEGNNFYRLKIHELDGNNSYSPILMLRTGTNKAINILLYPNPVKGLLFIKAIGADKEIAVRIYSMSGKKVYDKTINPDHAETDLTGFLPGVYAISITYEDTVFSGRITKEL